MASTNVKVDIKQKFAPYLTPKESYRLGMQSGPKEWEGKLHLLV